MVLAAANVLYEKNINYQQMLLVHAQDISEFCVYMTYVQMSLYGIAGSVTCGNTLTLENRFTFYTPMYYIANWDAKQRCYKMIQSFKKLFSSNNKREKVQSKVIRAYRKMGLSVSYKKQKNNKKLEEATVKGYSQIKLW